MSAMGTVMSAVSLAAYQPVRDAVSSGVKLIGGDLARAGEAISGGFKAVVNEVDSDTAKVKQVLGNIGKTIDTFV